MRGGWWVVLIGAGAVAGRPAGPAAPVQPAPPRVQRVVIDAEHYGDCKALGDLDGDGAADLVVAGGKPLSRLAWYRAPRWTKTLLATEQDEFTTDMQAADLDGDRDLDLVLPLGAGGDLIWFENPRPGGDPAAAAWPRHRIGRQGDYVHDLETGDFNRDGGLDLVARVKDGPTALWLRSGPAAWKRVNLPAAEPGEGTAVADLNRDGRPDVIQNGYWLECPADAAQGRFEKRIIAAEWPALARVAVGDLNADGRPDVALAPSESPGRLSWFAAPADPRQHPWPEQAVDGAVSFVHGLQVAEVDGDGDFDLVFAEMAQSPTKRVGYYRNERQGTRWTPRILATTGSHNLRAGRAGSPPALLILGCNWQGPPVELWRLEPAAPLAP